MIVHSLPFGLRLLCITALVVLSQGLTVQAQVVVYVNAASTASVPDGQSWNTAFPHLQDGLAQAAQLTGEHGRAHVWVAAGTYYPDRDSNHPNGMIPSIRTASFHLIPNVHLYGGFAGTETQLDQRDPQQNLTILSGNIGWMHLHSDNSYHVVTASGQNIMPLNCQVDGFDIRDGVAENELAPQDGGGGISCTWGAKPRFKNCRILHNRAVYGGGAFVSGRDTAPEFVNCELTANTVQFHLPLIPAGGGIHIEHQARATLVNCSLNDNGVFGDLGNGAYIGYGGAISVLGVAGPGVGPTTLNLINCVISGNGFVSLAGTQSIPAQGGAIWSTMGRITLINCTIANNAAALSGGGLYSTSTVSGLGSVKIYNSIFWGNSAGFDANQLHVHNSHEVEIRHSNLQGGASAITGVGPTVYANNLDHDPMFVGGNSYDLQYFSPCLNNGDPGRLPTDHFDLNNNGNMTEPLPLDFSGRPRQSGPSNCVDIGAYEHPALFTCTSDVTGSLDGAPDGVVNIDDLLFIISAWGGPGGRADIAPGACGDGIVNVDDLLAIISHWGACGSSDSMPRTISECWNVFCAELEGDQWQSCVELCIDAVCEQNPEECH